MLEFYLILGKIIINNRDTGGSGSKLLYNLWRPIKGAYKAERQQAVQDGNGGTI